MTVEVVVMPVAFNRPALGAVVVWTGDSGLVGGRTYQNTNTEKETR
jgi:hypothetical protein